MSTSDPVEPSYGPGGVQPYFIELKIAGAVERQVVDLPEYSPGVVCMSPGPESAKSKIKSPAIEKSPVVSSTVSRRVPSAVTDSYWVQFGVSLTVRVFGAPTIQPRGVNGGKAGVGLKAGSSVER